MAAAGGASSSAASPATIQRKVSILGGSIDGKAPPANPDDVGRAPCPLESCSWWSGLSFTWLNPIIRLGMKRVLEEADLPALSKAERAERLQDLVLVRAVQTGLGLDWIGLGLDRT